MAKLPSGGPKACKSCLFSHSVTGGCAPATLDTLQEALEELGDFCSRRNMRSAKGLGALDSHAWFHGKTIQANMRGCRLHLQILDSTHKYSHPSLTSELVQQ